MLQQNIAKVQIRTSADILGFLRQQYADCGKAFTFTELQQEMESRNGLCPDSDWLNCKLWQMVEFGEINNPIGPIIPTGVLSPAEADAVTKTLYRLLGLTQEECA